MNIKLAKTGGLSEALAMVDIAREAGLGVRGRLHDGEPCRRRPRRRRWPRRSTARPRGAQDLDAGLWLSASPVAGGLTYRGRVLEAMTAPGLGIGGLAPGTAAGELAG